MASLTSKIKLAFRNRASNGVSILSLTHAAISQYRDGGAGDWTNVAWIIASADNKDKQQLRDIIGAVSGMEFKADAKQPTGLRLKTAKKGQNVEAIDRLGDLGLYVDAKCSFNSKFLSEGIEGVVAPLLVKPDAIERTVEEVILAAVKSLRKKQPESATDVRIMAAMHAALEATKD
jgi:hypothetical protein